LSYGNIVRPQAAFSLYRKVRFSRVQKLTYVHRTYVRSWENRQKNQTILEEDLKNIKSFLSIIIVKFIIV